VCECVQGARGAAHEVGAAAKAWVCVCVVCGLSWQRKTCHDKDTDEGMQVRHGNHTVRLTPWLHSFYVISCPPAQAADAMPPRCAACVRNAMVPRPRPPPRCAAFTPRQLRCRDLSTRVSFESLVEDGLQVGYSMLESAMDVRSLNTFYMSARRRNIRDSVPVPEPRDIRAPLLAERGRFTSISDTLRRSLEMLYSRQMPRSDSSPMIRAGRERQAAPSRTARA